jgi:AcrR family transcriptional regulator
VEASVTDSAVGRRRPACRGPERREAICEAVFKLLGEVGYDRMTMDRVAEKAHASKATIYRMWPDKPELVVESIMHHFAITPDAPNTGSLRGDLMSLMTVACKIATNGDGDVISGLITAAARTPALAETLQQLLYEGKKSLHETVIRQAVDRAEIPADTDPKLLHEVMHAMILSRKLWSNTPLDPEYVQHVVDDVLLPILTHRKT